jgi:hypothetical protein
MPMEKRTSKNYSDMTLEELLQLPPDELMAALEEIAMTSDMLMLPPEDHPIFQEGWLIFTIPSFGQSNNDTTSGSENSET